MSTRATKGRGKKSVSKRNNARAILAGSAIIIGVIATILIFAKIRSYSPAQPGIETDNRAVRTAQARRVSYEVLNSYPHDPTSFTQGLLWRDGKFYESSGQYGQSKLRCLDFPSGKVVRETRLSPELFGEGLALVEDRLIQLTWTTHRGFVYDLANFRLLQEFSYNTEGWGLAYDGKNLILSDGSSDLLYLDPQTFKPVKKVAVRMNGQPIRGLNELEFIDGEIWANVWQTDLIVCIDPATGLVTSFLDLAGILAPSDKTGREDVLNGIAYDPEQKRIFITGKLWPRIFEIRLKS